MLVSSLSLLTSATSRWAVQANYGVFHQGKCGAAQSLKSIRGSPGRATDEASEWSSHGFSRSSSPLSTADELHERIIETVEDVDQLSIDQLERGRVVDEEEQGMVEGCEYVDSEEEEEEEGEEFTVMGRHGALISLIWGATALYLLLIRAKVQLFQTKNWMERDII